MPEWLFRAQRRLKSMPNNERLDEELFCLSNWLSLNHYEIRARNIVVSDFKQTIINYSKDVEILTMGSFEYDMYSV